MILHLTHQMAHHVHNLRRDRGQGSIEYVGLLLVIATLIGVVATALVDESVGTAITDGFSALVAAFFTAVTPGGAG